MASTSTGMTRLTDSFPFDSKADGYDSSGYPVYDRAVGATTLQDVFAKFFTNGVFPNPGTALQIGKADIGLAVTIQPGIGIINGAMGGVDGDAMTVQLDTASPQGNVAYSIMLRYDNTDSFSDSRSLLINVVRSDAATTPTPPEPDTTSPNVYELRLGYVVVPSGATDLSSATVTNEKGLAVCPYAAPFEEIDVEGIVSDFKVSANEALTNLLAYYQANKAAIDAALDDSAATYLQQQISALQEQMENFDLSGSVDDATIEYAASAGEVSPKLKVKDGGINQDKIDPTLSLVERNPPKNSLLSSTSDSNLKWLQKGTVLWEGSYEQGEITVAGLSNYRIIECTTSMTNVSGFTFGGTVMCGVYDDRVYGLGSTLSTQGDILYASLYATMCIILCKRNGDTLSSSNVSNSSMTGSVATLIRASNMIARTQITKIRGIA